MYFVDIKEGASSWALKPDSILESLLIGMLP